MAGCLKKREITCLKESSDVPSQASKTEGCYQNSDDRRLKLLFDEFLEGFLKEIDSISCYRPLPPLIGQGQEIDLFRLHRVVRSRGGYCSVSENGLWGLVAVDCGLDSGVAVALKLVYVKYLDALDRFVRKIVQDGDCEKVGFGNLVKELDSGLEAVLCKKSGDEVMGNAKDENDAENVDYLGMDEDSRCRKRKRESCVGMLEWIRHVAKDPCSSAVGELPEMHKWKSYGSGVAWKQVLWARETVLLKKNDQHSVWQKQKMHPSMYDDDRCSSVPVRCSRRLSLAKDTPRERHSAELPSSHSQSDEDIPEKLSDPSANPPSFWEKPHRQKKVPIGLHFQAELPEFSGPECESDSKWLGTKTWPLEKGEYNARLIERDPIGKGRQESCGCQFPGSPECVKFHIQEKRMKVKLELGPAFYKWKFDGMGEEVAHSWTEADMNKFKDIVESNPLSSDKYFWDELFKFFPTKGREALVSYYFNVFLLRRRSEQNRNGNNKFDSDDEESEYGPVGNKFGQTAAQSIFRSPRKSHSSDGK